LSRRASRSLRRNPLTNYSLHLITSREINHEGESENNKTLASEIEFQESVVAALQLQGHDISCPYGYRKGDRAQRFTRRRLGLTFLERADLREFRRSGARAFGIPQELRGGVRG